MKINLLLLAATLSVSTLLSQNLQSADQIIQEYKEANKISDLNSKLTYKNISKKGNVQRRELEQYVMKNKNGTDTYNFLLRFVAPADVKNTSTLTIQHDSKDDDQWLYLPVIRTAKRISSSKKSDRFMGTEMSYEDLSNYLTEPDTDYDYELINTEEVNGQNTYHILAMPKSQTSTQYSKRELWITSDHFVLLRSDFYDKKERLLKQYVADDIRLVEGSNKYRAHSIKLHNVQTNNRTEVSYKGFVINQGVDKGIFTKSYIETL